MPSAVSSWSATIIYAVIGDVLIEMIHNDPAV